MKFVAVNELLAPCVFVRDSGSFFLCVVQVIYSARFLETKELNHLALRRGKCICS